MKIEKLSCHALTFPNAAGIESDGTLEWSATHMVLVECTADSVTGLGYSYTSPAAKRLIDSVLAPCVQGRSPMDIPLLARRMLQSVRNLGHDGLAACAISAVDVALWDLKARLLNLPLCTLLGAARERVTAYASGGFTSSSGDQLARELDEYRRKGFSAAKIKVGREPAQDEPRVRLAREVLGPDRGLMVDANGAYRPWQALEMAARFAEQRVRWFEEPVSSDDLVGLAQVRRQVPAGMAVAAGEYGYLPGYFEQMLGAEAVDILQADATRCLGISGFLQASALCTAHHRTLSSHCGPSLHLHLALATPDFEHLEFFRDHAELEPLLFDGAAHPVHGQITADLKRPGLGLELRRTELARHTCA